MLDEKNEAQNLIESIYEYKREKCPEETLINTILNYSWAKNIPLQEIGYILHEHKEFIAIFEKQLIRENHIRPEIDDINVDFNEDEWL